MIFIFKKITKGPFLIVLFFFVGAQTFSQSYCRVSEIYVNTDPKGDFSPQVSLYYFPNTAPENTEEIWVDYRRQHSVKVSLITNSVMRNSHIGQPGSNAHCDINSSLQIANLPSWIHYEIQFVKTDEVNASHCFDCVYLEKHYYNILFTIDANTENQTRSAELTINAFNGEGNPYHLMVHQKSKTNSSYPSGGINTIVFSSDFETDFGDWSQESNNDFNWSRRSGGTPSGGTGPTSAIKGDHYIYTEASSPNYPSKIASITSVPYAINANGKFSFNYHMKGGHMGQLTLAASTDGGNSWQDLWSLQGDQGDLWHTAEIDLSALNEANVNFRFKGVTGSSYQGDISIDNIQITSQQFYSYGNENHIQTKRYTVPTTDGIRNSQTQQLLSENDKIEVISFFDDMGRTIQNVGKHAGGHSEDIVTHIAYDEFGRQIKDYLPVAIENNGGRFVATVLQDTENFYQHSKYENTLNPYSEKLLEDSPLNRVLQRAAPGNDWALGNGHEIEFDYQVNQTAEVRKFTVSLDTVNNAYTPTLVLSSEGYYEAGVLHKTIVKDENHDGSITKNHTTETFKDQQGNVVLKRAYVSTASEQEVPHDTYYSYDAFGNLSFVIPPKADISDGISTTELSELCYQYHYDAQNRLAQKKIPGKDWEYIVYDQLDRPALTQDANLRVNHQWLFTKYDVLGRVVYTGIYTHDSSMDQSQMQEYFNNAPANAYSDPLPYEQKMTVEFGSTYVSHYYSTMQFPYENIEILTVNYYDDYHFNTAGFTLPLYLFNTPVTNRTKSLATGSKVKVLGTNDWITTLTVYDEKARPIWTASHNAYLQTTDIVKTQLDFTGKIEQSISIHRKTSQTDVVVQDQYTYDPIGRPLSHTQTVADSETALSQVVEKELITLNNYDELGQLQSKKVGGAAAQQIENSGALQTVDYKYNIRGWLKNINEDTNTDNDLFNFSLAYNNPSNGTALFNGNISQTSWSTLSDNLTTHPVSDTYTYSYDAMNRITGAVDNTGNYNLHSIDYDKNGNILSLSRQGHTDTAVTTFGHMDDLAYTYDNGNKLLSVTDSGTTATGFKDNNTVGDDYDYDANGNMTEDKNKGITAISYNHLNLPIQVSFGSDNISYIYDATGKKLAKVVNENGHSTTTEYAVNYVYQDGALQFFNTPEGYATPNGNEVEYVYQYKDHLGNVRLSYTETDAPTLFFEDFEDTEGWDGTGNTWGHPLTEFDTTFKHTGAVSGRVNSGNNETVVHSTEWISIDNAEPTEYTYSCWAYSDSPVIRLGLVMKEEGETGYLTEFDEIITTNVTGRWIYLEKTALVPAHIKTLNIRIAAANWGDGVGNVWFDAIRLHQTDAPPVLEIVEENNYYPFGLKHKGYNTMASPEGNSTAQKFKYNGIELEESLGLDLYEMDLRSYDPAIARWTGIDPVTHHSMSTYTAFDNNPVFWADPSGADATVGADGLSNDQWLYNTSAVRYDEGEPLASWGSPGHGYSDAFDAARGMAQDNFYTDTEKRRRTQASVQTGEIREVKDPPLTGTVTVTLDNGFTVTLNRAIIYGEARHTNGDGLFSLTPVIGPLLRSGDRLNEGKYLLSALEFGVALVEVFTVGAASVYSNSSKLTVQASNRVFWSGGSEVAGLAAENFARANGLKTLEMTIQGKVLTTFTSFTSYKLTKPLWSFASKQFAKGSTGTVHVFHNASTGVRLNSIWKEEFRILNQKNHIIYHNIFKQ